MLLGAVGVVMFLYVHGFPRRSEIRCEWKRESKRAAVIMGHMYLALSHL